MGQNRDITLDILKGIGIILVIIGHVGHGYGQLVPIIYTFHMPLFFIASGYFFKQKKNGTLLKRDLHSLILPYIVVFLCLILYGTLVAFIQHDYNKVGYWINAFFEGEGRGPLWFLLAMFWARMLYNILYTILSKINQTRTNLWCLLITFIPFALIPLINNPLQYNILCWLNGIHAMFYYSLGAVIKEYNIIAKLKSNYLIIVYLFLDIIFIYLSIKGTDSLHLGVNMAAFKQNHLIINILVSIFSFILLYYFCSYFNKVQPDLSKKIAWYGQLSLVVFCMHTLLYRIFPFEKLLDYIIAGTNTPTKSSLIILLHIIITIVFCKCVEKSSKLKYLFNLK